MYEKNKDNVFKIFYTPDMHDKRKTVMRMSTNINDPNYRRSAIRSSIKDQNVYRGFNLQNICTRHRMSQGLSVGIDRETNLLRQTTDNFINFYQEDDSPSDDEDIYRSDSSDDDDGPVDLKSVNIQYKNGSAGGIPYKGTSGE